MLKKTLLILGLGFFAFSSNAQQNNAIPLLQGGNQNNNNPALLPANNWQQNSTINSTGNSQISASNGSVQPGSGISGQHMCKSHELNEQYWMQQGLLNQYNQENLQAAQNIGTWAANHTPGVNEISVIFHVVYNPNNPAENVSNALIMQVFQDLTEDYLMMNADVANARTGAPFNYVPANPGINFCLATQDPSGNPLSEIGVIRVSTTEDWYDSDNGEENKMKSSATGGSDIWDRNKYLNVWICDISTGTANPNSGTAGYAYRPSPTLLPSASIDGIVLDFNLGMNNDNVLTHETGHYLGLDHTWGGSGGCGADDGFGDTPVTEGPSNQPTTNDYQNSCSGSQQTCTGTETQYENYMDYANCTCMFTQDQANYMLSILTGIRSSLLLSPGCDPTNTPPNSAFTSVPTGPSPVIIPQNASVNFYDQSTNVPTGWTWTISGTQGVDWQWIGGTNANSQDPQAEFYTIGFYDVTLTASNVYGTDATPAIETSYVQVVGAATGIGCDTLRNWNTAANAGPITWNSPSVGHAPGHATIGGNNALQWAEMYTAPLTTDIKAVEYAALRISDGGGDVIWKVYADDAGGVPGTVLAADTVALANVNDTAWNHLNFNPPATNITGNFWVGFEISYTNPSDTFSLYGQLVSAAANTSYWQKPSLAWESIATTTGNAAGLNSLIDVLTSTGADPIMTFTASDDSICVNGNIIVDGSGSQNNQDYRWYVTGNNGTPIQETSNSSSNTFNFPYAPGNYEIYLFGDGSCVTDGVYMEVELMPAVTATVTPTATTCGLNNGSITISGEAGGDGTYYYSIDGVNYYTSNSFTGLAAGDYDVYVATFGDNCDAMYTVTVGASSEIVATASANQSVCPGGSATITASGGISYVWTDGVSMLGATPSIVVTPANTTQYACLVTDGSGCQGTVYTTVTVNPIPTATATNSGAYCPGDIMSVNETGGDGTSWSWTSNGSASFSNATAQNPTVTGVANGEIFTVTVTDGNGCVNTSNTTITINPQPNATATNTGAYCLGDAMAVNETAGDATGWSWSSNGSATFSNSNAQNPTVTGAVNGEIFTVTVTDGNGCTNTSNTTITVNPLPAVTAINYGAYCAGDPMAVNEVAGDASAWSWSSNGSATFSNSNAQNPTVNGVANGEVFTVTVTDGNGCQNSANTTITVNPTPNATASNTGPVCNGTSFSVNETAGDANNWSWSSNGSASFSNSNAQNPTVSGAVNGEIFTVNVTDANGCTNSTTTTVTIIPSPVISSGTVNNPSTCATNTGSIQITGPGGTGDISWSGTASGSTTTTLPYTIGSLGAGSYTITYTDGSGCVSNSLNIGLNDPSAPSFTFVSSGNPTTCSGTEGTITLTGLNPSTTYNLTYDDNGSGVGPTSITTDGSGNYTVTGLDAGSYANFVAELSGCTGSQAGPVVLTDPAAPNATASNSGAYCAGDAMDVNETAGDAVSWSWTSSGSASFSNPNAQNPTITGAVNGETFTVTVTDANGCTSSANTTVTINTLPNANATNTGAYCAGDAMSVGENAGSAISWSWTSNGSATFSNPNAQNPTVTGGVNGEVFTVTVTGVNGCTNTANTTITVNPLPNATAMNSGAYCPGDAMDVNETAGDAISWSWTSNGSATFSSSSAQNPTVTGAVNGEIFTVNISDVNGCSNTAQTTITINPAPAATAVNSGAYCAGDAMDVNETGGDATTWSWSSNGSATITNATDQNPAITGAADGEVFTVSVTDANGCTNTAQTTITINALPSVNAGTDQTVCDGDNITLSGSGAASYSWDNGVTNGVAFTQAIGTVTYTVTGTDGNGCSNTDQVDVTVNALPTVDAGADQTVCEGTSVTVTGAGAVTYTWDNGVTDGVAFTPSVSTITYTVTGTDANGCSNSDQMNVTVNANPTVSFTAADTTCLNYGPFTLSGSPAGGTWSGTGIVNTDQFDPGTGVGTYTITYAYTDGNGCTGSASQDIVVDICTGIDEGVFDYLQVFPNPTFDEFTIVLDGEFTYRLLDTRGRLIQEGGSLNKQNINVSPYEAGVYFVNISAQGATTVVRLVKE